MTHQKCVERKLTALVRELYGSATMEIEKSPVFIKKPTSPVDYKHPLVLGVSVMALGFCLGSGRWDWLGRGVRRISESIGEMLAIQAVGAFQAKNPEFFSHPPSSTQH